MNRRTALGVALAVVGIAFCAFGTRALIGDAPSHATVGAVEPASLAAAGPRVSSVPRAPNVSPAPTMSAGPTAAPLADGWRIEVPRLNIALPLRDGDLQRDIIDQSTPVRAAYRLPGSSMPGEQGNLYVYAHARTGVFLSLWGARAGDVVMLVPPTGAPLRYVVALVDPRVDVTDIRYMIPTADERLTLQTSTGPFVTDPRFVVVALPQRP